ncbi:MAG: 50S ribosomal protein L1 [Candidatus Omnitrophica bacterium]|nr:50S ribosomal protein L1 [Candidatus Omnitrophota bacterium]
MMNNSKRYIEAKKLVEEDKSYSIDEALEILNSMPKVKFDETIEISGKLGADPKQSEQMVRGSVKLPHGIGKDVKVLVFCEPEQEAEAKAAGADYIGSKELIDKILKEGWVDFDCCISIPSMMRLVSRLGKFLGPRGLMPSPKIGTVTENIAYAVKESKQGKIDFRMDKSGCIHVGVGKISFTKDAQKDNIVAFVKALEDARPPSVKGVFVHDLFVSTTMSPSLKISL